MRRNHEQNDYTWCGTSDSQNFFCDDFVFTIPLYQRAYAWTTEEAEELLQDLLRAMNGVEDAIDDLPPYFLGSVVLIKSDEPDAQVVDGQQRLTTLTMLLAVLRSLVNPQYADNLTFFLSEKENVITGTPKRYRLRLRERDARFFQQYIQDEGGIEKLKALQEVTLPDSQRNIRDNALSFMRELQKLSEGQLMKLTQFIINRCFLIVVSVSTPDPDSVYRIFSVLNSRGLDLSYPDILKAEIINHIPTNQQDEYASKWEDTESILGGDAFENLFFHLRSIFSRKRAIKGLVEEFQTYVYPQNPKVSSPQHFIDEILIRYANALNNIVKANYQQKDLKKEQAKEINSMFKWLNQLDHQRWIPPALYYFFQNWQKPQLVSRFLKDLERLVVSFVVCRIPPYKRIDRYCEILNFIYVGEDLYAPNSPLQLTLRESRDFVRALNGDIYLTHHICRYILLRLDSLLSDGSASYDYETISIEHVLPQRPAPESEWMQFFPTKEVHQKYVHQLGNLVLLSRGKNMKAENYDFDIKKNMYFRTKEGISPFVLTSQVLRHTEWTPTVIEQRQQELMANLKRLWRL